MNIEQIIHAVIVGKIPQGVDAKTQALLELTEYQRLAPSVSAVLLSAARRDDFNDNAGEWLTWARETFKFDDCYIHQLRKVGDMLLAIQENEALYKRLFRVSFNNLLPLTQLDYESNGSGIDCLEKFVEVNPVEKMTREQVRDAVALALGRVSKSGGKEDMYQPDLFGALDTIIGCDPAAVAAGDSFDEVSARKFAISGVGLLEASINYWSDRAIPDLKVITMIEGELIKEQQRLALLRESLTKAAMSG